MKCIHSKCFKRFVLSLLLAGGVFIVIFVGIGLACVTLAFEYYWYKYKRNPRVTDLRVKGGGGGGIGNMAGIRPGRPPLAVIGRPDDKMDSQRGSPFHQPYNYRYVQELYTGHHCSSLLWSILPPFPLCTDAWF